MTRIRIASALAAGLVFAPASGRSAVSQIEPDAFEDVTQLSFESLDSSDIVANHFVDLQVNFAPGANAWLAKEYLDYGSPLAEAADFLGLGNVAIEAANDQEIRFGAPVRRAGFFLGSNFAVQVPIAVDGPGAAGPASFLAVVPGNEMRFFGFEDPEGIASIRFNTETTNGFTWLVDGVRFEAEPTGSVERIGLGDFDGDETVLSFEEFPTGEYVVDDDFASLGVTFEADQGEWQVEMYSNYDEWLVAAAAMIQAGDRGLFHRNENESIDFDPPTPRVSFYFGSSVDVRVPVTFRRGNVDVGTFSIVVPTSQLGFFGFADPQGIEQIRFGTEEGSGSVSNLDLLRFAPEPGGAAAAALGALAALARRRSPRPRSDCRRPG